MKRWKNFLELDNIISFSIVLIVSLISGQMKWIKMFIHVSIISQFPSIEMTILILFHSKNRNSWNLLENINLSSETWGKECLIQVYSFNDFNDFFVSNKIALQMLINISFCLPITFGHQLLLKQNETKLNNIKHFKVLQVFQEFQFHFFIVQLELVERWSHYLNTVKGRMVNETMNRMKIDKSWFLSFANYLRNLNILDEQNVAVEWRLKWMKDEDELFWMLKDVEMFTDKSVSCNWKVMLKWMGKIVSRLTASRIVSMMMRMVVKEESE